MILFSNLPYISSDNDANILTKQNDDDVEVEDRCTKVLQSLNISNNDLSEVPNELLARGVCNVFRINLGKI